MPYDHKATAENDYTLTEFEREALVIALTDPNDDCAHNMAGVNFVVERIVSDRLKASADEIERELICCDVFERLRGKPVREWTSDERSEYRRHSICYWGMASRRIVLSHMVTPPASTEVRDA